MPSLIAVPRSLNACSATGSAASRSCWSTRPSRPLRMRPAVVEDLRLRQHAVGVEHEVAQQLELRRRHVDRPTAAAHLVRVLVELEVLEAQGRTVVDLAARTAQDGPDAGDDLLKAERLGDVV